MQFKRITEIKDKNYFISDTGEVLKVIILKTYKRKGYRLIKLFKNKKRIGFLIHRLVYKYFGEKKWNDDYDVHHKDTDRENNFVENLDMLDIYRHLEEHKAPF